MKKTNLIIAMTFLACLLGCKSFSGLQSSKPNDFGSQSPVSNTPKSSKDIPGLEGTWRLNTGKDEVTLTFQSGGRFQANEAGRVDTGTYQIIDDSTVDIMAPGKPTLRITNIKINGNSITMTLNGRNATGNRVS